MRAHRVKAGFHRIGVVVAVLIAVPSIGVMLSSILIAVGWAPASWEARSEEWIYPLWGGAGFLVVAGIGYLASWTLGWIIAGFVGDTKNLN